jgi:hypothetical protein
VVHRTGQHSDSHTVGTKASVRLARNVGKKTPFTQATQSLFAISRGPTPVLNIKPLISQYSIIYGRENSGSHHEVWKERGQRGPLSILYAYRAAQFRVVYRLCFIKHITSIFGKPAQCLNQTLLRDEEKILERGARECSFGSSRSTHHQK